MGSHGVRGRRANDNDETREVPSLKKKKRIHINTNPTKLGISIERTMNISSISKSEYHTSMLNSIILGWMMLLSKCFIFLSDIFAGIQH